MWKARLHSPRNTGGKEGLSLVELLIVLAIVSMMAAVAVPVFIKMASLSRGRLDEGAQDIYQLARSARIYASANRVETAVVYALKTVKDSRDGTTDQVIADAVCLARRLTEEERRHFFPGATPPDYPFFVTVNSREGQFRTLPYGTAIRGRVTNIDVPLPDQLLGEEEVPAGSGVYCSTQGLTFVRLYQQDGDNSLAPILPRLKTGTYVHFGPDLTPAPYPFPAHVFRPDCAVRVANEHAHNRLDIRVGASPDVLPDDRFVDVSTNDEIPGVMVEINRISGRIHITDEE